jgi:ankyrin repeat protein
MELLLEGGASIGAAGGVYDSAIQVAATYGHIAATKLLLTFGADDLAQASSWMTASVIAGRSGYAEIAALITHNVRPLVRMP